MATVTLDISNSVPPVSISIKKPAEGYERFRGYGGNTAVFEADTSGVSTYNVLVTDANGCTDTESFTLDCTTLPSVNPDFNVEYQTPFCSSGTGGTLQPAIVKLTNMVNAARYSICYGSNTFSCGNNCNSSDGMLSGNTGQITLTPPVQGNAQDVTIRVYSSASCTGYRDFTVNVYSPKCDGQFTLLVFDAGIDATTSTIDGVGCQNPSTNFDMYFTPNTVGMSENGQVAQAKGGVTRNLPNGNDVPNVMISSALLLACGPGPFYRWAFNLSYIKGKYPNINVFTFDLYANRLFGSGRNFTILSNAFRGVKMVKLLHGATPPNSQDAYREPVNSDGNVQVNWSSAPNNQGHTYDITKTGYRKIGTMSYNFTTNVTTYVNVP